MNKSALIVGAQMGSGLARHVAIVEQMLMESGFDVTLSQPTRSRRGDRLFALIAKTGMRWPRFDLQIFMQDLNPRQLPFGRHNMLIPMQEWFDSRSIALLVGIDSVICNSRHSSEIFGRLHANVRHLSFTSVDRRDVQARTSKSRILHVAGRSHYKGTEQLVRIWRAHPEWPTLTLVHSEAVFPHVSVANIEQHIGYIADDTLREFQNDAWLHLQPSEAEGFGHCIFEAMSCGGIVLTLDAPPMNELVDERTGNGCLVGVARQESMNLGFRYFASDDRMEQAIQNMLALPETQIKAMSTAARDRFEQQDSGVRRAYRELFAKFH